MITTIKINGVAYSLDESVKMNGTELAAALGYCTRTITEMKAAGAPFFGRFSSIEIIRKWEFHNPRWREKVIEPHETS